MYSCIRARAWLIFMPLSALALLLSGCGGGGGIDLARDASSLLTVDVDTGNGNGTTVDLLSDVQLDKCVLVLINGTSQEFDLGSSCTGQCHVSANPKLKYARVLAKNGGDYWYFDRSGTYLSQGANDPKVAIPGDY